MPVRAARLTIAQRLRVAEAELRAMGDWCHALQAQLDALAATVRLAYDGPPLDNPQRIRYTSLHER